MVPGDNLESHFVTVNPGRIGKSDADLQEVTGSVAHIRC